MSEQPPRPAAETDADSATCYRHPDREAHIRCTRCERRICPDCMVPASVGFQCPECVREGHKDVRTARTMVGGRVTDDPGWVSKILIGVNVVVFALQQVVDGFTRAFFDIGLALDPQTFEPFGVADGEYYRLLTSAFLHSGVLHLLLNMYALFLFGPQLEAALGRGRFIGLYALSALGGSALSYSLSAPNQASLGASGAVFGLLGAFLVVSRRLRRDTTSLLVLLAVNLGYGFIAPQIDWKAHVGGLIAGALLAVALVYAPRQRRTLVQVTGALVLLVVALGLVVVRTVALQGALGV